MQKLILIVTSVFLMLACEPKEITNEQNLQTNPLVGKWQLVEQKVSIGGPATWQDVEDGDTFELKSDGSFVGFQLFSDCSTGDYEATEEELILSYNCQDDTKPFTYSMQKSEDGIVLSPKTIICTETCEYKYRKIDE